MPRTLTSVDASVAIWNLMVRFGWPSLAAGEGSDRPISIAKPVTHREQWLPQALSSTWLKS